VSYAFVFRAYPDVDHMVPLVWRLLEDGEEVHGIVTPGLDAHSDYRLRFVERYENFHLHEVDGPLRRSLPWALRFVARHDVKVVGVEWGYGLTAGFERPRSLRGAVALVRAFAGSIKRRREPRQLRTNFVVAARTLGRAAICLPHGLSVKLDGATNGELQAKLAHGPIDWRDRNRFDAYVLNTEHHRRWFLENAMGDPERMETLGSLRWAPQWFALNREIAPRYAWPAEADGRVKVVFMVPKWGNRVDGDAVLELVRTLQDVGCVSLAVKGHPRPEDGSADPLRADPAVDWSRVHDASAVDSVSLIDAADVVIDAGSSIGVEVVMQDRVLVNPTYLHELRTLFDAVPRTCIVANGASDVVGYLRTHAAGARHHVPQSVRDELLRRAVYGEKPAPFDVLDAYSRRVRSLAERDADRPRRARPLSRSQTA
jgi:hypothetical protein